MELAAGALVLIAVVAVGLLIIKLDERQQLRQQLELGLTDKEVCWSREIGISLKEMARRKEDAGEAIRQLYATMGCLPWQPTAGRPPRDSPAPTPTRTDGSDDSSDPLVIGDDSSSNGGCSSGSHGGE